MNEDQEKQPMGAVNDPNPSQSFEPPQKPIKSSAMSYAELELEVLCKTHTNEDNQPIVKEFIPEILALVNKFGLSGQSGGSAPYTAAALADCIKKLCLFQPICDITGDDSEWGTREGTFDQNKRCGALFRTDDNKCYYLAAITFKTQKGTTWSTQHVKMPDGSTIGSRQYVKSFPWKPKTFIIDVIETEVRPDDWEFEIKDVSQLNQVWEYYDRFYQTIKA